jgi:uncharacterized protein YcbX
VVTVGRISTTPVRGFRLDHPPAVELTEAGVVDDRRFLLCDGEGKRLRSSVTAWPVVVRGGYDPASEVLRVTLPDGSEHAGSALASSREVRVEIALRGTVTGRVVEGAWNAGLSALAGHPVAIVRTDQPGQAQPWPVTLFSTASVERLAGEAGQPVDQRRFRMLFEVDGCDPHEEDGWVGRELRIGSAVIRVEAAVDRCAATTRDPATGKRDLDTLALIAGYRGRRENGDILFGVGGTVVAPGRVAVGDPVAIV